jgi:two-component sensor histidine kinase
MSETSGGPRAQRSSGALQESETHFFSRLARISDRIDPYSGAAIAVAAAGVLIATLFRGSGAWVERPDLLFETYLPAVLITSLLAGVPAGLGVMIVSIVIVAFIPPHYELKWPLDTSRDQVIILLYLVSCLMTIFFAHCYRVALHRLRQRDLTNQLLARELAHRGRNLLSVIQAVVHMTLVDDPERAKKLFARIRSILYANELGAKSQSITMTNLLLGEFAAYGEDRLDASGPEFEIEPETAGHLMLLFHELLTNCVKYGSLSSAKGRVVVEWQRHGQSVVLTWKETGGPPVRRPTKEGFGSRLIAGCAETLLGTIQSSYSPDGFACSMTFRLDR